MKSQSPNHAPTTVSGRVTRRTKPRMTALLVIVSCWMLPGQAGAATTSLIATGDWNVAGNWSAGLPTHADTTSVDGGFEAMIGSAMTGTTDTLRVGDSGKGILSIDAGGTLTSGAATLGYAAGSSGTLNVTGGTWTAASLEVGHAGSGTLFIDGGVVDIGGGAGPLVLAAQAGSVGTLNIGPGSALAASRVDSGAGTASVRFLNYDHSGFAAPLCGTLSVDIIGGGLDFTTSTTSSNYSGGTTVRGGGVLIIDSDDGLGAVPATPSTNITLNGGMLVSSLISTGDKAVTLHANRNISLGVGGGNFDTWFGDILTINGEISGSGGLGVAWDRGAVVLNGSNSYSGPTVIGTSSVSTNLPSATPTLRLGNDHALPGTDLYFGTNLNNTTTLDLNGFDATVATLTGGPWAVVDVVSGGGASTLSVGNRDANGAFSGTLQNTSGNLALTKIGAGTQTLSGTGTYTGGTTILAGRLAVANRTAMGTGSLTLSGSGADTPATLECAFSNNNISAGAVTLNGFASIVLPLNGAIQSTGSVAIHGMGNSLVLAGDVWSPGTHTLLAGTSLTISNFARITLTGAAINGGTLAVGDSLTTGNTTYTFGANASSLYLQVADAGTPNSLMASGNWNVSGNWSSGVPAIPGITCIDGNYAVTVGTGVTGIADALRVGNTAIGTLFIATGGALTSGCASLGYATGSDGRVAVSGGTWTTATLEVGHAGTGTLDLTGGDVFIGHGSGPLMLATQAGSVATLNIGTGSSLYASRVDTGLGTAKVTFLNYEGLGQDSAIPLCGTLSVEIMGGCPSFSLANSYSGGTTMGDGGALIIDSDNQLGSVPASPTPNITLDDALLMSGQGEATLHANRSIVLGAGGGYLQPAFENIFSVNGAISGSGGLGVAWDCGVVILNGSNSYTGATTIGTTAINYWDSPQATPTLQLGHSQALPGTDLIFGTDLDNTATLDLHGYDPTVAALGGGTNAVVDVARQGYGSTLTVGNGNADGSFQGILKNTSGVLALAKIGAGTQALGGSSTYTGGTTIYAGRLAVGNSAGLGTGVVTLAGSGETTPATLEYTLPNSILNVGAVNLYGSASIVMPLNGGIQSTGAVYISGIGNSIVLAGDTWSPGKHTLLAGTSLAIDGLGFFTLTGQTLNGQALTVGASLTIGNITYRFLADATSLYLQVAPINFLTASGDWNIPGNWSCGVPVNSGITCVDGGFSALMRSGQTGTADTLWIGNAGTGTLAIEGSGALTSGAGCLGYAEGASGTANVSSGSWTTATLEVGHAGTGILNLTDAGAVVIAGGSEPLILAAQAGAVGTLNFGPGGTLNASRVDTGLGTATVNFLSTAGDGTVQQSFIPLCGTLSVNVVGGGVYFSVPNSYSGGTTVRDGGTLNIDNDDQLGAVPATPSTNITLDGGQLLSDDTTLGVALDAKRLIGLGSNGGILRAGYAQPFSINGAISGSGGLGVAWDCGVVVLKGSNSYTGATTIGTTAIGYWNDPDATPTLQLGHSHALPGTDLFFGTGLNNTATLDLHGYNATVAALASGPHAVVDVMGGGSSTLTVGNGDAYCNFQGVLKNTGGTLALTKIGTGTQRLSSASTYTGGTTVLAGRLVVDNNAALGTGGVTLSGSGANALATLDCALTNSTLNTGVVTLDGFASIILRTNSGIQSTGAVAIHGSGNTIVFAAGEWSPGTHALLAGTSLTLDNPAALTLSGPALNGQVLTVGASLIINDTTYTFLADATSLYLRIAPPNSLIASGDWDHADNWSGGVPGASGIASVDGGFSVTVGNGVTANADTLRVGDAGTGTLNLTGTGVLTLAGGNGPLMLAVQAGAVGTLNLGTGSTLNATRVDTGLGTATVNFYPPAAADGTVQQFFIPLCGTLSVNVVGGGVYFSVPNSYSGGTTVRDGGTLKIHFDNELGAVPADPGINITLDDGLLRSGQLSTELSLHPNRNIYLGAGGGYLQPADEDVFTILGAISGVGGLGVAWDCGVVVLKGSNSYAGATTIGTTAIGYWNNENATPTLQLGNPHALPGTDLIFGTGLNNTATLDLNGYDATVAALIGGAKAVVDIVGGGGSSSLTVGNGGADGCFSGMLRNTTGNLALTKIGAGTQTLSGTNTYTGGTTVLAGRLTVDNSAALGTGAVTLTGGGAGAPATLDCSLSSSTLGVGPLALNGFASIELPANGAIRSTGTVVIHGTGNAMVIAGDAWNPGTHTLLAGTSLELESPAALTLSGPSLNGQLLAVGASLIIGDMIYTFGSNATSVFLQVESFDSLLWSGAASDQWDTTSNNWRALADSGVAVGSDLAFFTGAGVSFMDADSIAVTAAGVRAGEMRVDHASGSIVFNGGAIAANALSKSGAGTLSISNAISLDGGFLNTGSGPVLLSGSMSQGELIQNGSGTLTLAASNPYTGATTVSAGTLLLADANAVLNSTLVMAGGGVLFDSAVSGHAFTLGGLASSNGGAGYTIALQDNAPTPNAVALSAGNNQSDTLYAGALSGSGSLTKIGSGTLTLTGHSTYQGATLVTNGELRVAGGGTISQTRSVTVDSGNRLTTAALTVDGLLPGSIVSLGNMTVGDAGNGVLTLQNWGIVDVGGRYGKGTLMLGGAAGGSGTLQIGSGAAAGTLHAAQVTGGAGTNSLVFNHNEDAYSFTPQLTGFLDVMQQGSGNTVLTGDNTHTGTTTIAAGTLSLGSGAALGTAGAIRFQGGTLQYGATNALDYSSRFGSEAGQIYQVDTNGQSVTWASPLTSADGTLHKTGAGALTLTSVNTYSGGTRLNAGTLGFATDSLGAIGTVAITGNACLQWQAGNTQDLSGRLLIQGGVTATIDTLGNAVTFASALQTGSNLTGSLAKSGIGTLTLTEVNAYTGGTTLNAGTLAFATGALGSTGTLTFAGNACLQWLAGNTQDLSGRMTIEDGVTASIDTHGNDLTFVNTLQTGANLTGSLAKTGTGTLTLTAVNNYTGGTTLNAGTLAFAEGTLGTTGPLVFAGNACLQWLAGTTQDLSGRLKIDDGVTATLDTQGNDVTFASTLQTGSNLTGALTKAGLGTLTLSAGNDHAGATTVSAGTLVLSNSTALHHSTLVLAGGSLVFDQAVGGGAFTLGGLAGAEGIVLQDNALTPNAVVLSVGNNNAGTTYAGSLSGSGSLTKVGSGTLMLTGHNTYQGATLITQGELLVAGGGAISQASGVTVDSGNMAATAALTVDGLLSGRIISLGNMTVGDAGNGVLTLRNSGVVEVGHGGGTLMLGVTAGGSGTLQIGSGDAAGSLNAGRVTGGAGANSLVFNHNQDGYSFTPQLTGFLDVVLQGCGTTVLTGNNTYTGTTTIAAGTLSLGSAGALGTAGAIHFLGGTLQYGTTNTNDYSSRFGSFPNQSYQVDTHGQSVTWASPLTSAGGTLTKTGAGTLALTSMNTYTGGTTLSAGTLAFVDSALSTGAVVIGGNACLQWLNGNTQDLSSRLKIEDGVTATLDIKDNDVIFTSTLQTGSNHTGALAKTGAGTLSLTRSNAYTGGTTLHGGTLAFAHGALGSTGTVALGGDACLQWLTGNTQDLSGRLQIGDHTATIDTLGNDVTFASALSGGSLAKAGTGTLTLSANNTYSGSINVGAGTLHVTGGQASTQADSITVNSSIPGATLVVMGRATNSDDVTIVNITSESLTVGDSGSGTLSISEHGYALVNDKAYIGDDTGSSGLVTVNHANWWMYDDLSVGHSGTGTLNVNNDSYVHNDAKAYIGYNAGSNGLVTIDGALWAVYGNLSVGYKGTGTLNITGDGSVETNSSVNIGEDDGAVGTVTVDNSTLTCNQTMIIGMLDTFTVGSHGTGTLNLTGGSTVKIDPITYVGDQSGSRGTVNVGDGSKLELSDSLLVGYGGSGTLNITDGGTVEASSCYVGDGSLVGATGQGFVTVSDSTLKCTAGLLPKPAYIINIVNGSTLDINHKGKVESDTAAIGASTVTVSNDHSSWKCNGAFKIGDRGKVFVTSGATITMESFEIRGGSQVSVTSGGTITAKSVEIKGGSLVSVTSGGTITANSGSVSNDATVTVDGTDSLWDITDTSITGTLSIDNATLTLSNGGIVKVGDPSDTFSVLNLGYGLYVSSQGTLNIGNGGGAGTLSVGYVFPAMLGTGAINFNHNEASHTFAPSIQGAIAVNQIGSGVTVLSAENTFTGGTHIEAGGLRLANQNAAYNSMVQLSGGNLLFDSSVSGHAFTLGGLAATSAGPGCDLSLLDSAGSPVALSIGYNNDASTYAGVLSGSGSLTKIGDGTLTLAGANTHGGHTTVRSGTLTLANARTLQNSTLSMSGGSVVFDNAVGGHAFILGGLETDVGYHITLQDNAGNPVALSIGNNNAGTAYAGILSGAGSLTKIGSGTLTLADANTYTGDTTVSAGKLILKNPLAVQASTLRLSGGALVFDSSVSGHAFTLGGLASSYAGTGYTIALQDNALTPAAVALSIGNNDANSLYAGALTGCGSLTKEGSGTLTLTGQSSYQGATLITQGAVIVEGGGSISKTSRVTVDSGDSATTAALTVDGLLPSSIVVLGNMTVGAAGGGTLTLRNWGTVNVGGRNGTGVLTLADHAGSVGTLNIDSGDGAGTLNAAQVTGGAGTASVNFNQTDDSYIFLPLLTGSVALNQNGSGTTVLVRSNTHAGATQVTAGSLQVANGSALQNSTLTMIGGNLIFDSAVSGHDFTLGGLAGENGNLVMLQDNATTPNAVALSVGNNNSNTAYAGNLSGTGSLTKIGSGTLALNGTNNYDGLTAVTAGTLLINGSNTGTGAFNVAAGATLGGTGSIAVAINVTGVLAPGASIGTLTSGALTLANHSTYQYEVDSSVSATVGADLHIVNGALNLGSSVTLNLSDLGTGKIATGTVFSLFNYATGLWNNALFTYNSTDLTDDSTFNFLDKIWTIDYNATAKGVNVAGTESGNYVNISATDAYTLWIQTPGFAIPADKQGPADDPDGDGASNLKEFAFGGRPNDPSNTGLVFGIQAGTGGARQMILTIAVRDGTAFANPGSPAVSDATVDGLNYAIQGSTDLTDWTTPVTPVPVVNPGLPTPPPDYQYVSFGLSGSDGLPTQGFLRGLVEMP